MTAAAGCKTICATQRTRADNWVSWCGECAWLGLFTDHHVAHYTVRLHGLVHHGSGMGVALDWLPYPNWLAAVPENRRHGQRRIEALLEVG